MSSFLKFASIVILFGLLDYLNCTEGVCFYNWRAFFSVKECKPGEVRLPNGTERCKENSCLRNNNAHRRNCERRCLCDYSHYRGFNDECILLEQCVESYSKHLESLEQYKKEKPVKADYTFKRPTAHTVHVLCYDDLGCFDKHRISDRLPHLPETMNPSIAYFAKRRLFDKLPINGTVRLYPSPFSFVPNQFVSRLVCISHGFRENGNEEYFLELKDLLLQNEYIDLVLVLDWGQSTYHEDDLFASYYQASANTEIVGRQMGLILSQWRKQSRITSHSIHLWGFSLGSHVINTAAMFYTEKTNEKVRRLSLIDAANPNFDNIVLRPTPEAAQFVEAYHTSGGDDLAPLETGLTGEFAINRTMGHIDFFINGGSSYQPGCDTLWIKINDPQCSHNAAKRFFKTSFQCVASSIRCDSGNGYKHNANNACNFKDISTLGVKSEISIGRGRHYIDTINDKDICQITSKHRELLTKTETRKSSYLRTKKHKLFG